MKLYLSFNKGINNMWYLSNGQSQNDGTEKVYFRSGHTEMFSSNPSYFGNKLDAVMAAKILNFDIVEKIQDKWTAASDEQFNSRMNRGNK